jgi:hypothetical protein
VSEWIAIDEEAHTQIEFILKDGGPLDTVVAANSAKEAWDLLAERYTGKGMEHIRQLMTQVVTTSPPYDVLAEALGGGEY